MASKCEHGPLDRCPTCPQLAWTNYTAEYTSIDKAELLRRWRSAVDGMVARGELSLGEWYDEPDEPVIVQEAGDAI